MEPFIIGGGLIAGLASIFGNKGKKEQNRQIEYLKEESLRHKRCNIALFIMQRRIIGV